MMIRKIQWGYNPNSSSIGVLLFAVPPLLFLLFPVYLVIGFIILWRLAARRKPEGVDDA